MSSGRGHGRARRSRTLATLGRSTPATGVPRNLPGTALDGGSVGIPCHGASGRGHQTWRRSAMAAAEVGDDVFLEDPTLNRLQERAAAIFKREAALYVPSGTMGNLICLMGLARPGQEVICEEAGHTYNYEMAGMCSVAKPLSAWAFSSSSMTLARVRPVRVFASVSARSARANSAELLALATTAATASRDS